MTPDHELPHLGRRRFVRVSAAALAVSALPSFAQAPTAATATIVLDPSHPGPTMPNNFIGLSYETSQLADPTYFAPANKGLIACFTALSPHGVLRIGGNTSDFGWFKATPSSPAPPRPENAKDTGVGEPAPDLSYALTPASIDNLRKFLDATGWSCIYGLNLGTGAPARAAEEAAYVARALGPKLEYLQIGNEPDLFIPHLRPTGWTFDNFFDEWLSFVRAIEARVPDARFGLPDGAANNQWLGGTARRLATTPKPPRIAALSHHYYIGGPPTNPGMTIDRILSPNPSVTRSATACKLASTQLAQTLGTAIPYRMTEGNTCYRGGKPGVSDVFAASLWSADYLLQLASLGYAGVNLHGGSGKHVADSLGGKLPGEDVLTPGAPDDHPRPFYTPIAELKGAFEPQPVFYGMKLASLFAGFTFLAAELSPTAEKVAVYAASRAQGSEKSLRLALINKTRDRDLTLTLDHAAALHLYRLHAPSLEARSAALGTSINRNGRWVPGPSELLPIREGHLTVTLPRASALILSTEPLTS